MDHSTMESSLHIWPSSDKFVALFGNGGSLLAWFLQPSTLTALGGAMVSLATTAYFIARTLQVWQRRKHEAQLHQRTLEAYFIECRECSAMNPAGTECCEECGEHLRRD